MNQLSVRIKIKYQNVNNSLMCNIGCNYIIQRLTLNESLYVGCEGIQSDERCGNNDRAAMESALGLLCSDNIVSPPLKHFDNNHVLLGCYLS